VLAENALGLITARSSRSGTLFGVGELCELLEPHLAVVKALIGPGALTEASAAAQAALALLGTNRVNHVELRKATDRRDRLATAVVLGHDRLRVYVALLTSFREAQTIVRPLHPYRGRRRKRPVAQPAEPEITET